MHVKVVRPQIIFGFSVVQSMEISMITKEEVTNWREANNLKQGNAFNAVSCGCILPFYKSVRIFLKIAKIGHFTLKVLFSTIST